MVLGIGGMVVGVEFMCGWSQSTYAYILNIAVVEVVDAKKRERGRTSSK